MHDYALITTLAAALGLALLFGFLAARLRLPALVGYLVAGVVLSPGTPGFAADMDLSQQLAEIGVILLMFGVGLHFSLDELLSVRRIALPGAIVQVTIATILGMGIAHLWGWDIGAGIVFGLSLSVASTVVLLRALEDRNLLRSVNGHIAVGWLVVEDLVSILVLVILPPLSAWLSGEGAGANLTAALATTLGKVVVFIALMLVVGRRLFPWLLWQVARTGSRELFTLCVIAAALGIAWGAAELFGVSFALGAFFAGIMLRESELSYRAAEESLPLRDAFSVLFFVSVGMLFEPSVIVEMPFELLTTLAIIMIGSPLAAFTYVLVFRYPLNTALTVSAALAQIGEFSFIISALGVSLGMLPVEGQNLILAAAIISIALNPLLFRLIEPAQNWIRSRSRLARMLERRDDPLAELPATINQESLTGHVVLVGFGRVGSRIGEVLIEMGIPVVVAEQNRELVEGLRARGVPAVSGDTSDPATLIQAHIVRARILIVAIPLTLHVRKALEIARTLNPGIETIVRTHSDEETEMLQTENAGAVFMGEHELAASMTRHVLERIAHHQSQRAGGMAPP